MKFSTLTAAAVSIWGLTPLASTAAELHIYLSGQAFEGGPAFEIAIGDHVIGSGILAVPIAEEEQFTFVVPDEFLMDRRPLAVRLTNDKFAAGEGDRNLVIVRATLNGATFDGSQFIVFGDDSLPTLPGRILSAKQTGELPPPPDGWIPPPSCDAAADLVFPFRVEALPDQVEELEPVLEQATGACKVEILGYASTGGSAEANIAVSLARARAVEAYLDRRMAKFASRIVEGRGATTLFGSDGSANRRVTVRLTP